MESIEFYVIYNWMRDELELSGTELDCYAVIYSLSQSDNRYIAGVKRLMELLHKTEPTIIAALKALTKKGLVTKEPVMVNNIKRYYYKGKRPSKDNQEPKENKEEKGEKDTTLNNLSNPLKPGEETTLNDLSSINNINNKENNKKKVLSDDNTKNAPLNDFEKKMKERFPNIMKMEQPLTLEQAMKLKERYNSDLLLNIMKQMDNYRPLVKKNISAYKTIINWCEREEGKQ